jgi:AAA domain
MQEVVVKLSTDQGLTRVVELCDRCEDWNSEAEKIRAFTGEVLPLLTILCHPDVQASPLLEPRLGQIFSVLHGFGSERSINLFEFLVGRLKQSEEPAHYSICLQVFANILRGSTTAIIHPQMQRLGKELAALAEKPGLLTDGSVHYKMIQHLKTIDRHLKLGLSIPEAGPKPVASLRVFEQAKFVVKQPGPGGRHDNDKEDICDIKIMPTLGEITSLTREYLPMADPDSWHITADGIDGLLDRQFRLLREDTVGQLRDAVRIELDKFKTQASSTAPHQNQGARTYVYRNLSIIEVGVNAFIRGMTFWVSFDQPEQLQNLRKAHSANAEQWWENSKRLQPDSLLCLLDTSGDGFIVFCVVTGDDRETKTSTEFPEAQVAMNFQMDNYKSAKLSGHSTKAYIRLKLVSSDTDTVQQILDRFPTDIGPTGRSGMILVEFPGILLPAFEPTLKALQTMKRKGDLPFAELLTPPKSTIKKTVDVPPPAYAQQRGFTFNLQPIMDSKEPLHLQPTKPFDLSKLQKASPLDDLQAEAVARALRTRLALIQGPPGTGKSYCGVAIIRILLHNDQLGAAFEDGVVNKFNPNLGPILAVCYTNHALDQLLEHLVKAGVDKIIRMGSQSKSEVLKPLNLNKVVRETVLQTKAEAHERWQLRTRLKGEEQELTRIADVLRNSFKWSGIKRYLSMNYPKRIAEFEGIDEEGFITVRHGRKNDPLNDWLSGFPQGQYAKYRGPVRPVGHLERLGIHQMLPGERRLLLSHWVSEIKSDEVPRFIQYLHEFLATQIQMDDLRNEESLRCLQQARIIGVTSSGMARNLGLLHRLRSKVVVMEEAGELLEAHSITSVRLRLIQQASTCINLSRTNI